MVSDQGAAGEGQLPATDENVVSRAEMRRRYPHGYVNTPLVALILALAGGVAFYRGHTDLGFGLLATAAVFAVIALVLLTGHLPPHLSRRIAGDWRVLAAAAAVVALGLVPISVGAPPSTPGNPAVPTVIYTKTIVQKFAPRLRVETETLETWSASNSPLVSRTVLTIAGGPRFEMGFGLVHDRVLGRAQAFYLYDPSTQTNWLERDGPVPPPLEQRFKHFLADSGSPHPGTRMYLGRSVYIVRLQTGTNEQTYYIDKRTFEPLMSDVNEGYDLRTVFRTVIYKTLPATKANLALTSLPTAHPRAKTVLFPTQHMRELNVFTDILCVCVYPNFAR
jgi:hypothetical protein